jgi:hypothetical protein
METFVLRVWTGDDAADPAGFRGVVRHVPSGDERPFASAQDLEDFVTRALGQRPLDPRAHGSASTPTD